MNHNKINDDKIMVHCKSQSQTNLNEEEQEQKQKRKHRHKNSKRWFSFLSSSSASLPGSPRHSDNDGSIERRRSTLSALFNSFMNHHSYGITFICSY